MDSGLIQYTGFTGLSVLTSSLTSLNFRISCVPRLFTQKVFKKFVQKKPYLFASKDFFDLCKEKNAILTS